jgi:hypothetical protein
MSQMFLQVSCLHSLGLDSQLFKNFTSHLRVLNRLTISECLYVSIFHSQFVNEHCLSCVNRSELLLEHEAHVLRCDTISIVSRFKSLHSATWKSDLSALEELNLTEFPLLPCLSLG